MNYTLRTWTRR